MSHVKFAENGKVVEGSVVWAIRMVQESARAAAMAETDAVSITSVVYGIVDSVAGADVADPVRSAAVGAYVAQERAATVWARARRMLAEAAEAMEEAAESQKAAEDAKARLHRVLEPRWK